MNLSLIITTPDRLDAFQAALHSLAVQSMASTVEIVVADSGAALEITQWLQTYKGPLALKHVRQKSDAACLPRLRNKAVQESTGEYLIFIEGDCLFPSSFLRHHSALIKAGYFVTGAQVYLSKIFTETALACQLPVYEWSFLQWLAARLQRRCNRITPFFPVVRLALKARESHTWRGASACNFGVWRKDFLAVNGFDAACHGSEHEEHDLFLRLMRCGIRRRTASMQIPVIQLCTSHSTWEKRRRYRKTLSQEALRSRHIRATAGILEDTTRL